MSEDPKNSIRSGFLSGYAELLRHVTRRLGRDADAGDVIQDTFLRIQRIPAGAEIHNARSYLYRMADNQALDHLRERQSRQRYFSSDEYVDPADDSPSPEAIVDYRQRLTLLQQAIAELPARQKEVFLLHKFDGFSHSEIAERLGITRSAVEKLVMKALAHCRDRLGDLIE
ncbi:RNA polymerase sigma factor [Kaistia terrae]|uniref:RNA polymerase sigma factor n=1 Tax=Kaistia terrae TaxID=537017 RepID=A0ABW0PXZ6_9HYPH|nr:sigma-70 family RNA polymerase sigma factor [Kaistia terrae]MCX5581680.1 sigma-70 family RNA polymerase sigma factor [Kaistia terrae]